MAPRGCLLLPLIFIASSRVFLVDAKCGDIDNTYCTIDGAKSCAECTTPGSLVPDPKDCNNYYVCVDENGFLFQDPFPCPDGEIFDLEELICKADGNCTSPCVTPGGGDCRYVCDAAAAEDHKIADPFDCGIYYPCAASATDPGDVAACPDATPYFDGDSCGKDESACCYCHPFCYTGDMGKLVEDPTDCRKFFVCTADDTMPTIKSECPAGEHFDIHLQKCSSTAPCVTLCKNVVGEDSCIDPFTCQETGIFPVCKEQCIAEYYRCTVVSDDYISPETCPNGLLFNPDTLTCVEADACPYKRK